MLTMDQERRITPGEALNHAFVTLAHLVDYAHCNNVKASVQMMEPVEALNHAFVTLAHLVDYAHCNNVKASVQMMEVCPVYVIMSL
ncbi:Homeodomain-interacting protein kinase 2 [Operophtera brumata]|uniref:Homeodomain-interacting protein kinase 2 n=1 Tax=Operophtera brumata TaxID=104452 RepID=A0A0L7L6R4_OPEBR|nr:Homeodomain-interacting protein kinase 2 [Operophtera brumata]